MLKGAISDVRTVLGDDPRSPRFIETVPRRGYRFIASLGGAVRSRLQGSAVLGAPRQQVAALHQRRQRVGAYRERRTRALCRPREGACAPSCAHGTRTSGGARVIAWIAGEPGHRQDHAHRALCRGTRRGRLRARPVRAALRGGEPYHPVLEALAELCRRDPDVPALLRAVAPTWLLQLPWLSTAEQREALRDELVGVNARSACCARWANFSTATPRPAAACSSRRTCIGPIAPTIQLIDYLARRRSSARLMWLSSFRLAEVIAGDHPLNALRHELHLHGLCEEIVLDSFSEAEVAAYLAERSPSIASDESFVRALHERTEGVPLFVASMTSDVAARSAQSGVATAALLANLAVPDNLLAIIDHYSSKLGNERRVAALGSRRVRHRVSHRHRWRACSSATPSGLRTSAISCCASNSGSPLRVRRIKAMRTREPYSFRHALFRQVLYDRLAPSARADLHRKVGTALEQERAEGRSRRRRGARDALRPRPLAAGGAALLRRGSGSGSAALGSRPNA